MFRETSDVQVWFHFFPLTSNGQILVHFLRLYHEGKFFVRKISKNNCYHQLSGVPGNGSWHAFWQKLMLPSNFNHVKINSPKFCVSTSNLFSEKGQFLPSFLTPGVPKNGSKHTFWQKAMLPSNFYHVKTYSLKFFALICYSGKGQTFLTSFFDPWGTRKWVNIWCLT